MITNNNVDEYIELLKARIVELETDAEEYPTVFYIRGELFNVRKELLSARDQAEYNTRHMNALTADLLWKEASANYQTFHLHVTERIAYASESQAAALTRQACALETIAAEPGKGELVVGQQRADGIAGT